MHQLEANRAYCLFVLCETLRQPRFDASANLGLIYFGGSVDVQFMRSPPPQLIEVQTCSNRTVHICLTDFLC